MTYNTKQPYPILVAEMKHANSVKSIFQIGADAFQVTLVRKYAGKGPITSINLYFDNLKSAQRDYSNIFF